MAGWSGGAASRLTGACCLKGTCAQEAGRGQYGRSIHQTRGAGTIQATKNNRWPSQKQSGGRFSRDEGEGLSGPQIGDVED